MTAYSAAIYYLYEFVGLKEIDIPLAISTILGFAISIVLGFRTNSAYDRWWEARKVWGEIANQTTNLTRQLIGFADLGNVEVRMVVHYLIYWSYALKNSLRGDKNSVGLEAYLPEDELIHFQNEVNQADQLLSKIEQNLKDLNQKNIIDSYQLVALDATIKELNQARYRCEGIKNTVFPIQYRVFTNMAIFIFLVMLPYGMLQSTGIFVIPISIVVMMFFVFLERIAHYLQNPFRNKDSDIPMSSICRNIEISLLSMINVEKLPDRIIPDSRGVLK